ncbi:MAG: hypothetical protein ACREP7_21330 [Lysobacter sp.]
MGCDIHVYLEHRDEHGEFHQIEVNDPLSARIYTRFAFLAGVRNRANIMPLSSPRGLPFDVSDDIHAESDGWRADGHTHSWFLIEELLNFDYDQPLIFREGGRDSECTETTYRELLDDAFLPELRELQTQGVDRLIFWFDN